MAVTTPSFTCPLCRATSFHPVDVEEGWCDHCHDFTGEQAGAGRFVFHGGVDPRTTIESPDRREE